LVDKLGDGTVEETLRPACMVGCGSRVTVKSCVGGGLNPDAGMTDAGVACDDWAGKFVDGTMGGWLAWS